jgi:hypothetical protein
VRQRWRFVSVAAVVCSVLAGGSCATAAASELLGSSHAIERQVDAARRVRVMRSLASLRLGSEPALVFPQQLDSQLGRNLTPTPASPKEQLDQVEIEARAPPGVAEEPLQAQIPFGLPAVAWGVRHPGEAWRLFVPVLS